LPLLEQTPNHECRVDLCVGVDAACLMASEAETLRLSRGHSEAEEVRRAIGVRNSPIGLRQLFNSRLTLVDVQVVAHRHSDSLFLAVAYDEINLERGCARAVCCRERHCSCMFVARDACVAGGQSDEQSALREPAPLKRIVESDRVGKCALSRGRVQHHNRELFVGSHSPINI